MRELGCIRAEVISPIIQRKVTFLIMEVNVKEMNLMKVICAATLTLWSVSLFSLSTTSILAKNKTSIVFDKLLMGPQSEWTSLSSNVEGDELLVLIPSQASVHVTKRGPYTEINGAKIKEVRTFITYDGGVLFIVEAYDTSNPDKALKSLIDYSYISKPPLLDISINGFRGKLYLHDDNGYYSNFRYFSTKHRVYVIGVATRDKSNPAVNYFLSSLRIGSSDSVLSRNGDLIVKNPAPDINSASAGQVIATKELTRKAILVMKREPYITREARIKKVYGSVFLRLLLSSSGFVTEVKVIKGVGAGLDESAVEAAKQVKFIPAEKDGRAVSAYHLLEYGFN